MVDQYVIFISDEAKEGVKNISIFIRDQGYPETAQKVKAKLFIEISKLKTNPNRFSVFEPMKNPTAVFRSFTIWDYIIVYRVYEQEKVVVVIDVFHGSKSK